MTIPQPMLATARLRLLPADPALAASMLEHQLRNREHFAPWDPTPGEQFYTETYWTMQLRQRARDWEDGGGARFLLAAQARPERVIGTVSLSNIVRGVFQACHLGYGIDHAHQGQGLMREALEAAIGFAFDELKLHRIQANYQPANVRSAALLKRLGFVVEGRAKDYLYINGAWRDHVLTALTCPHFDSRALLG
ncbi:alanine acetyltransferase [Chromobacterium phragmitis]|uniref:Alanine acetyltransferase n=1 Tax=Chromobacterium phragmitis TaxID=2202141 RepID=A0A344UJB9_9NEIS|nr:GNAT family N-acetyltransferase [Chromobacterium phragmitis]AXE29977.1 alanine acetyltransferase [Chromobacterium phragmitis]AXE35367.1 alanine acetyltransferase [Chromobacterium phragmitis]